MMSASDNISCTVIDQKVPIYIFSNNCVLNHVVKCVCITHCIQIVILLTSDELVSFNLMQYFVGFFFTSYCMIVQLDN